jgi:protocatechuate 3,4-dioxygenase beta subunit
MRTAPRLLSLFVAFATLPLHAAISGSIMNADGQAIAAAKISVYGSETLSARRERLLSKTPERPPLVTATADSKGNFRIEPPKELQIVDLRVDAAGYAPEAIRLQSDDEVGAIILTRAESKSGTVKADGKGLAGATIVLQGGATFITTTDANGRYTVPDPTKWANRMMIFHPDYARFDEVIQFAKKDLDRTLERGVKVSGKVVGADGTSGVADAALDVDGWPAGKSGADGAFTVDHAPKNWQEMHAVSGTRIAVRANGSALTLKLVKGATITGSVRDIKTQLPLAGAEVQISPGGGQRFGFGGIPLQSAQTDAKGNFTFAPLAPGTYSINPNRPNYTIANGSVSVVAGQAQSKSFYATAVARVSGVVVDEDKRPVAAARVAAQQAGRGDPMMMLMGGRFGAGGGRAAFSGPDGRFVAHVTELDTDVNISALKKGWPATKSPIMRLASGERKSGLTLVIPRGIAFSGRVTDHNGKPLSGVAVDAGESQGDPLGAQIRRMVIGARQGRDDDNVTTAGDGTFSMRLKEGKYDVVFKREGFSVKSLRAQQVAANEKPVEVTLEPGVEITGRVVRGGVGVEGVNVNAMAEGGPASTVTASDGSFTLTDLTPGQMMLIAGKQEAMIQEMRPVTAPARDVVIEVPAGGRITGRVVDKATRKPITTFQAGVTTARGGGGMVVMMPPMLRPFTSDDGSFTLENVKPGPTQIVAMAAGYTTGRAPTIEVEDGKAINDVEIGLETGAKLVGHVTDSSGAAVAGVTVRAENMGGGGARVMRFDTGDSTASTDPSGDYSIDSIEPGEKTFVFSRSGYVDETKTITLAGGKDNRLDVTLGSGLRVGGVVVTEGGAPVAEATVRASSAAGGFREAHTDAGGAFQLEGLTPGHYNFTASKTGMANGISRDVDIATQNNIRITMKGGSTIAGHITGLSAKDLEQTTVMASSPNGNASAPVDSSGNYRIEGAPSGTVRVAARMGGPMMGTARSAPGKTVELEPGGSAQVDIEFKSDTTIRGRVTHNNQPVAGASINFLPRQGKTQTNASALTDSSGGYELSGLDDGPYNVQVMDMKSMAPYMTTYEVHGSGNFDVDMRTASLRGRVLDAATGQPIEGASVDIRPKGSDAGFFAVRTAPQTDSNGTFILDNVARGTYQVSADKQGYGHEMKDVSVDENADLVELKLNPSAGVTLKVVDGRDGTPLGANVNVTDLQGNAVAGDMPFRFGGGAEPIKLSLAPGTYRVTVQAMNYARRTVLVQSPSTQTIALTPGGTLLLRSKSSTALRGRLIDSNGLPYSGMVMANTFRITESPGTTTLQNIATGHYRLEVLDMSDRVVKSIDVDVLEGRPAEYDI